MNLMIKVLSSKVTWILLPILGLAVAAQDCNQGLAAAGLALAICGVVPLGFCIG
jgi:hypothetical protein